MSANLSPLIEPAPFEHDFSQTRERIEADELVLLSSQLDAALTDRDECLTPILLEERFENQKGRLQHRMEYQAHGLQEEGLREIEASRADLAESLRTICQSHQQRVQDILSQHRRLPALQYVAADRIRTQLTHFQQTWRTLEDRFFRSLEGL